MIQENKYTLPAGHRRRVCCIIGGLFWLHNTSGQTDKCSDFALAVDTGLTLVDCNFLPDDVVHENH